MNIANGKRNELQKWGDVSTKTSWNDLLRRNWRGRKNITHSTNAKKLIPKKGIWVSLTVVVHNSCSCSCSFPAIVLTHMLPPQLIRTLNKITPDKVGGRTCGVLCLSVHLYRQRSVYRARNGPQMCQSSLFSQKTIFISISMIRVYRGDYIGINSNWKLTVFVTLSSCT